MLKKENNYDFRKRMLEVHRENVRDNTLVPENDEFVISDGVTVLIEENAGVVIKTAAKDFIDYLFTSMGISAMLKRGKHVAGRHEIVIKADADLGKYASYKGYQVTVSDKLEICGYDERGAAWALYNLEDVMNIKRAPFLKHGIYNRKPMYSPMMVHSGYGLDEFPDEHLLRIAHEGRDAVLVFAKDVDITPYGYLDFNELIHRAAKYGIDVYAYSYIKSDLHPDDPAAQEHYEISYGRLFEKCPGLKGVTLVGESVEFPSKDEHVSIQSRRGIAVDDIPTGKVSPGWYPCCDYPKWLTLLKKVVCKHKSDADIVFWTYNWGYQPEEARVKLIESLPEGITLQATFEMVEPFKLNGLNEYCADYTLFFEGPGFYFKSEAIAAKKRGIKLYSMTNTGGLTWDFGVVPYLPMPYQWMKRYKAMENAHDEWGLSGIMEAHHYGFYPSFISKLSKWVFSEPRLSPDEVLKNVLKCEFGAENVETIDEALKLWSEAITHYTPTDSDQYGAFRVGPSYPFCLDKQINLQARPYAMFGNGICNSFYLDFAQGNSFVSLRVPEEMKSLMIMKELFDKGLALLDGIKDKNEQLLYLVNMGHFMSHYITTGINAKKWYCLKCDVKAERNRGKLLVLLDEMEALLKSEIENAQAAIPFVEYDSRLGWEPSMEYMTDAEQIRWKIRQVNFVLDTELAAYRNGVINS